VIGFRSSAPGESLVSNLTCGEDADLAVKPAVVPPVEPLKGGQFDVVKVARRSSPADEFMGTIMTKLASDLRAHRQFLIERHLQTRMGRRHHQVSSIYRFEGDYVYETMIYGPHDRVRPVLERLFGPA
jgi:hypothetical protein